MTEELEEAALYGRQSLIAGRRTGRPASVVFAIFLLACCATGKGDYHRAAQLTGAHDVLDATLTDALPGYSWSPWEQQVRDDNRARLRVAPGEVEFDRAYGAGRALGLDQAADLALGRTRGNSAAILRTVTGARARRGPVRGPARRIIPA